MSPVSPLAQPRRALYRLPLVLDRAGIPWLERAFAALLGVDWIVLETVGRRSGRPHVVMLDVVGRRDVPACWYVQPADGGSDWVRNVRRQPRVVARAGGRRFAARVRDASGAEGAEVVLRFLRTHPWYGRLIVWLVGYAHDIDRPDDVVRRDLERATLFAIEPAPPDAPPS
jgi:deazaflavin-dependent oxidoreductase (nitroreductase family)